MGIPQKKDMITAGTKPLFRLFFEKSLNLPKGFRLKPLRISQRFQDQVNHVPVCRNPRMGKASSQHADHFQSPSVFRKRHKDLSPILYPSSDSSGHLPSKTVRISHFFHMGAVHNGKIRRPLFNGIRPIGQSIPLIIPRIENASKGIMKMKPDTSRTVACHSIRKRKAAVQMLLIRSISLRVLQNDGFLPLDTGKIQRRPCGHQPSPKASADEFLEGAAVVLVAMA